MAGVWTAERRAAQAARARANRPWMKSTGPKSAEGKARVARNAFRTGWHAAESRAEMRKIRALFRSTRELLTLASAMIAQDKAQRRAEKLAAKDRRKVAHAAKAEAAAVQARKHENPKNKVKRGAVGAMPQGNQPLEIENSKNKLR